MIITSSQFEKTLELENGSIERRFGKVVILTSDGLKTLHQDFVEERIRTVQIQGKIRNAVQAGAQNFLHYLKFRLFD